ncbi:M20/M25/M40 family metallo-hydrolase [Pseudenhygromyxa sp. WMMC2535]|uniref:M20/M25/M40 family metallo-hydrolase n=1 Tax=Pseudenhygromyxa sp. WMMC2535 TaxID=2712867 RepID=UPI0015540691|nr:M20/M25/M40 family metallo-hydrolase [Pseudenhygromyxa sp. WMMC2535]NVB39183.1 M20/M25/M40 family metallo-hydrolase [Pseudenhygromyxa sp. WMMC2535]
MSRALLSLPLLALVACAGDPGESTVWAQPAGPEPAVPRAAGAGPGVVAPTSESVREPAPALDEKYVSVARKLTAMAEEDTRAWDRLAFVADTFGHRLSGSQALEDTIDWAVETMRADGLANARREKVMVPHWVRGKESAKILGPVERELPVLGLGMTVGTPRRGITAEVVVVDELDQLDVLGETLKGKIVVINQAMPPYDDDNHDSHYGTTVQIRAFGPSRAAKYGAKAVLIRSVTASSLRTLHTGMLSYDEDLPKIPAAAITPEDAEWFARTAARGQTPKVHLELGAKQLPDAESANVVAELIGREKPEEVVVIGGHIDSWDVGDGSTDDGAGCLMAMEAALMLKELGLIPRRTIRVVLFTNEENGLRGGKAYFEAHQGERHVAAIEADVGSGAPWGFGVGDEQAELDALLPFAPLFEGLGAGSFVLGGGGADISPLTKAGVLGLALRPDASHYFDLHHSPADTIDKIAPYHLERNAAAMALMAYILAERELPEPVPETTESEKPAAEKQG